MKMLRAALIGASAWMALATLATAQTDLDDSYPTGADIDFRAAHRLVSADLLDPSSAQYKQMFVVDRADGRQFICGWMNAKNQMGGYTPFSPFYVDVSLSTGIIGSSYEDEFVGSMTRMTFEFVECASRLGLRPSSEE